MEYLGWIVLTAAGILASLAAFAWALRSGQFADQERARYLPLGGPRAPGTGAPVSRRRAEPLALMAVIAIALGFMLAAVLLTMARAF